MWCKHTNYEQATRIPFLMVAPKAAVGASTKAMIESVDVFPTLCELAGLPTPTGLDGKSFAHVLRDPKAAARDSVTHVYPRNNLLGRAIRTERYRLVEWKKIGSDNSTAEFELYDYQADPDENRNLATDNPEIIKQLQAILARQPEAIPQVKTTTSKEPSKEKNSGDKKKAKPKKAAA